MRIRMGNMRAIAVSTDPSDENLLDLYLKIEKWSTTMFRDKMHYHQKVLQDQIFFRKPCDNVKFGTTFYIGNNAVDGSKKASGNQRCKTSCLLLPSN